VELARGHGALQIRGLRPGPPSLGHEMLGILTHRGRISQPRACAGRLTRHFQLPARLRHADSQRVLGVMATTQRL
jgi:hypothetical protein